MVKTKLVSVGKVISKSSAEVGGGRYTKVEEEAGIEIVKAIESSLIKVMSNRNNDEKNTKMTNNQQMTPPDNKKYLAPDGGWGWFVVFGAAIANMTTQSLVSTFGLLFGDALKAMGQETTGAALVLNFMTAVTNLSGLITGPVIRKFSYRKVALAGGIFFTLGVFLASFATTMIHFILSYSLLSGLGLGLAGPASFVAISTFFSKRRGRAVGLALAGTGIGQMLMPQLVRALLDNFGFQIAMLIISAVSLNGIFGAILYQPVKKHVIPLEQPPPPDILIQPPTTEGSSLLESDIVKEASLIKTGKSMNSVATIDIEDDVQEIIQPSADFYEEALSPELKRIRRLSTNEVGSSKDIDVLAELQVEEEDLDEEEIVVFPPPQPPIVIITAPPLKQDIDQTKISSPTTTTTTANDERIKKRRHKLRTVFGSCWNNFVDAMDLKLFLDPIFVNIVIGIAIFYVSNINFSMVFPFFIQDLGFTRSDAALCMTVTAAADISARLIVPIFTDKIKCMGNRNTLLVSMIGLAIARSYIAVQTGLTELVIISVCVGFVRGASVLNLNLTIAEYCDNEKLAAALGINMVLKFVAILSLGPFLGWLRDATGSYPMCIHAQSLLLILTALSWIIELLIVHHRRSKITTIQTT